MGQTYIDHDAETLAEVIPDWTPAKAAKAIVKQFNRTLRAKKKYAQDIDEQTLDLILGETLEAGFETLIRTKFPDRPLGLTVYTDGPLFSSNHDLFLQSALPNGKKTEKKKFVVPVDWPQLKDRVKQDGAQVQQAMNESREMGRQEEELRSRNVPTRWIVFEHNDLTPLVEREIGPVAAQILGLGAMPASVSITDRTVLLHLASAVDMPNVQQKIVDAADWDAVIHDVAEACAGAAELITADPHNRDVAEALIQDALANALAGAAERAVGEAEHFRQIRIDRRKYKIEAGVKIAANVVGIVAGIAGLALTPFTLGASTVIGCVALWRSSVQLGDQLGKLALEAEETAVLAASQILGMLDAYEKWRREAVGAAEIGKELLKTLLPTDLIPTIKGAKVHLSGLENKTHGIEIRADKLSELLSTTTDKELEFTRSFEQFLEENEQVLTQAERREIGRLMDKIPALRQRVSSLLIEIGTLNRRVKTCRAWHEGLSAAMEVLSAQNPTWAAVVTHMIPIATDIGLMAGGGVGGAAQSFGAMGEQAKVAVDSIGIIQTSGNDIYEGVANFASMLKKNHPA
jgi:hypothetical protein